MSFALTFLTVMTVRIALDTSNIVIPAKASIQLSRRNWVPAFAGMTKVGIIWSVSVSSQRAFFDRLRTNGCVIG